jgi:peptidoglycan/LPS O-acetylase OafA/YrhL
MPDRSLIAADSPNLDFMRGVAVLLVFVGHILETWGHVTGQDFHPLDWHFGRVGVLLFFVHTALVLTASLARNEGRGWVLTFYIRRIARIYPLGIVAVLLVVLLGVAVYPWTQYESVSAPSLLANLTLTMDLTDAKVVLAPLWTLPVEVQIYALLPIAFWFIGGAGATPGRAFLLLFCTLPVAILQATLDSRFLTTGFLPCFAAGVIAFTLRNTSHHRMAGTLWPIAILVVVGGYLACSELLTGSVHNYPLQWTFCLTVSVLIPRFQELNVGWWVRTWHVIAKYSYGIYLFHCMVLYALVRMSSNHDVWTFAALAVAGTAVMSVLAYHFVEAPMIRVGSRMAKRIRS